ncbi:F0F1 ATP synthase subunit B [Parasphingopyxis sp. CP4]|uniref:F0F1 ATP synthase subunit B family protein n=1 Tax=Parasphingopyxis sp. CP4 TaxID=2724527 RepID=UPI0015A3B53E|nr:F0F1 ATP synthase subunit B [Parasphingopyxis sp. CP4]QLC21135.1 F0F1 ATP synthase subunit B [Parasphingopyxis sp. CP4]
MDDELEPVIHEETGPETAETVATTEAHDEAGHETAWGLDTYGWVAVAMITVIMIMIWRKVPGTIAAAMDKRIAEIRGEIDEAAKLRSEAEALKAEYEAKTANADTEAAELLDRAREEAGNIVAQAEADAETLIERRSKLAEEKIAAAERSAVAEVRAKAASAAAAAAAKLIEQKHDADADKSLIDSTISGMDARLN